VLLLINRRRSVGGRGKRNIDRQKFQSSHKKSRIEAGKKVSTDRNLKAGGGKFGKKLERNWREKKERTNRERSHPRIREGRCKILWMEIGRPGKKGKVLPNRDWERIRGRHRRKKYSRERILEEVQRRK